MHTVAYPVDEQCLCELDHLQCDQQADGDQVVVEDDEGQQVVGKVGGDVPYTHAHTHTRKHVHTHTP